MYARNYNSAIYITLKLLTLTFKQYTFLYGVEELNLWSTNFYSKSIFLNLNRVFHT